MIAKLTTLLLVLAFAGVAMAADHDVDQVGVTFAPADIYIQVGDTVNWNWSSGVHTVTNGTDLGDPDLGTLFDGPLDAGNTTFSYTFNSVGTFAYLCRPHFSLDMVGTVTVEDSVANEDTSFGAVKNLFR